MSRQVLPKNKEPITDPDLEEVSKPKTWPSGCSKNVIQLRAQTLRLTQDEFARRLNVSASIIKSLENGKGVYDGKLVHKINQVFKVNINS
jgi:ribosome-binding protein aMBF1 (putative translation factor)